MVFYTGCTGIYNSLKYRNRRSNDMDYHFYRQLGRYPCTGVGLKVGQEIEESRSEEERSGNED
jgi:hypothetical protein